MKKLAAILFSIFYLTVTIGVAINVHYCHGEVESVEVFAGESSCCCGDTSENLCCHVDSQLIKFENDQASTSNFKLTIEEPVFELPFFPEYHDEPVYLSDFSTFQNEADLLPPQLPAWLRYCSLVYYG
jgi:hypothetical protein